MVNFSRQWNGDGFFSPTMEWRWFLKILTIIIDGMVPAQPLAAMVFQWFFQFWGPMVHNGYAFSQKMKFATKCALMKIYLKPNMAWNLQVHRWTWIKAHLAQDTVKTYFQFSRNWHWFVWYLLQQDLKAENITIAKNQWFLRWPLPLMEWYSTIGTNGFSMVFSQPTIGNDVFQWLPTIGPTMRW